MSIMQTLMTAPLLDGGSPPPPPTGNEFFWAGDQDAWIAFGGLQSNSVYSNPAPANPSYTYPDGSYTGKTRDFTGTEWMISMNLGIGGAWPSNVIAINLWFYPTANNVQIMSELNAQNPGAGYHYSMLEINSNNNIRARFYDGFGTRSLTSTNTVTLNQWNHIYFSEDISGNHTFQLNGISTTGLEVYIRASPGASSEYFAVGLSDSTNMVTSNPFQGKLGYITIADYVNGSTFTNTRARFGI